MKLAAARHNITVRPIDRRAPRTRLLNRKNPSFMNTSRRVSPEQQRRLEVLAASVCRRLISAGLPARVETEYEIIPGVEIGIDTGDDFSGGVYAEWSCGRDVRQASMDALKRGLFDDPAIEDLGAICGAMQTAIFTILSVAGFAVELGDTEIAPYGVRVLAEPTE